MNGNGGREEEDPRKVPESARMDRWRTRRSSGRTISRLVVFLGLVGLGLAARPYPARAVEGPVPAWEPQRVLDEALVWKRMFEDPAHVAAHIEDFRRGQQRFVERYPGASPEDYRGYISGFYPEERDGRFLPLTGVGCSRFVWAIFKTCYPDRVWDFMNTAAMYDLIEPALSVPEPADPAEVRRRHEARIRRKQALLGEDAAWLEAGLASFDLFEVVRAADAARPGDLVVWASGAPLLEKGHVGLVLDPTARTYVGANGPASGITVEPYPAAPGPGGPFFMRWIGRAPVRGALDPH